MCAVTFVATRVRQRLMETARELLERLFEFHIQLAAAEDAVGERTCNLPPPSSNPPRPRRAPRLQRSPAADQLQRVNADLLHVQRKRVGRDQARLFEPQRDAIRSGHEWSMR